jgi:alpha-mannosidase
MHTRPPVFRVGPAPGSCPAHHPRTTAAGRPARRNPHRTWPLRGLAFALAFWLSLLAIFPLGAAPKASLDQVIIVFKTHFDIGYTDMATNVVQRYRTTMIDDALKVVDQNRSLPPEQQFVWTIPGWPAAQILQDWPGQSADRQQRVRQAFKEGRFVVHALPFTTHTELFEPEDLVRGMGYSSSLARSLDLDLPRDAKMTDVPSHSWILPTLLRHAGVDFLHLGCNPASSSPQVPPLFLWEGPDGSRLLTLYSAAGYGTGLVPPPDWPYRTWLALIQTGDNHGPPRPDEVAKLLDEARAKLPGVKVRIGRLSDFADAVLAEHADIPVVRGDLPDTWIHGPLCDPAGARLARNLRPLIGAAESLQTHLNAWGATFADATPVLSAAREQSLLYGEHTWGGSLGWVVAYSQNTEFWYGDRWKEQRAAGRFQKLEASWAEHSAYIGNVQKLLEPVLEHELRTLAQAVDGPRERIVVFNPLPWKRDGLVTLPAAPAAASVKPIGNRNVLPAWRAGEALCFIARDVPPSGYRTYQLVPDQPRKGAVRVDESQRTIESPFFKAVLDPARGAIRSLVDTRTGRELVDASASYGFGQLLHERFDAQNVASYVKDYVKIGADWAVTELGKPGLPPAAEAPYRALTANGSILSFECSPGSVSAILRSSARQGLPYPVTTRLTLYAEMPFADLEVTVHDKPADPWPEAGWICFPFNVLEPEFRLGRLGGIEDPARDFVPGSNHDLGAIHTGLALVDPKGRGAGLCPLDSPVVSLDRPGCFRYSRGFVPTKPVIFVNLFNNQWSTNFRLWNSGTWTSRIRLWSFDHYENGRALIKPALEAREPLLGTLMTGAPGHLPPTGRGLEFSRSDVMVTAFGPDPDGNGVLLRLWEYGGKSGACQVRLPEGITCRNAQPIDLRGRPTGSTAEIKRGSFHVELHPFAPASFRLVTGPARSI